METIGKTNLKWEVVCMVLLVDFSLYIVWPALVVHTGFWRRRKSTSIQKNPKNPQPVSHFSKKLILWTIKSFEKKAFSYILCGLLFCLKRFYIENYSLVTNFGGFWRLEVNTCKEPQTSEGSAFLIKMLPFVSFFPLWSTSKGKGYSNNKYCSGVELNFLPLALCYAELL